MVNNLTPSCLTSLVPEYVQNSIWLQLEKLKQFEVYSCPSTAVFKFVLPSVISCWNELPIDVPNSPSVSSIKSFYHGISSKKSPPPVYYYTGQRRGQIFHTRTNCSALNLSIFQKGIVESPLCDCVEVESTDHFIFRCPLYETVRNELMNSVRPYCAITTEILLFGNPNLPDQYYFSIFKAFHKYIISSKRFD